MDPNYLDELKKLKEQKEADLHKFQEIAQMSIPDFSEEPEDPEEESFGETIKFAPVSQGEPRAVPASPSKGRRTRKIPAETEEQRRKKIKARRTAGIIIASSLSAVAVLLAVFLGIRTANKARYSYQYWGLGIAIEETANQYSSIERNYSFFGNLKSIIRYDRIGQKEAVAEFEKGNCIKESVYTPQGDVEYYYTHEYEDGKRILTAYFLSGQLNISESYSYGAEKSKVFAETTYYSEENRKENSVLTLSEDGNVQSKEIKEQDVVLVRMTYAGTKVLERLLYKEDGSLVSRTVYEYNAKRQLKTQTVYDANNTILTRTDHQYDEKTDLLKKVIRYDGKGEIVDYDTYDYDLNDNPIKQVMYEKDGSIRQQILKVFNDKNRVTKETCLEADGSIVYCYGYDYNDKGYITKSIVYNTEISTIIEEYTLYQRTESGTVIQTNKYNAQNIEIEKAVYNGAGFLTHLLKYTDAGILILEEKTNYDGKQRVTQKDQSVYADSGEKISFFSEQFDENGRVTIRISEDTKAQTYDQILFLYNEEGAVIQQTIYDKNGKTVRDESFDNKGRVIKEILFDNGIMTLTNEYTYDDNDRVTRKKTFDKLTGDTVNLSYSYNSEGKLTTSIETDELNHPIAKKEYSEDGNVSMQVNYDEKGMIDTTETFQYDEENRVIVRETFDASGDNISKIVYYYRADGSYDYTEYNGDGIIINDTRDEEEGGGTFPDMPPENPDIRPTPPTTNEEGGNSTDTDTSEDTSSDTTDTAESSDTSDSEG